MSLKVPDSLKSLDAALRGLGSTEDDYALNRALIANSIVCSLMFDGVVRGGFAMVLRYGAAATRATSDLDVSRRCGPDEFSRSLAEALEGGWEGFTFTLTEKPNKQLPDGAPEAYTTQNFDVRLSYLGAPWYTVEVEAGYNEFEDIRGPDFLEAGDANGLLVAMGFPELGPVVVLRVDQQIAQKLIGVSDPEEDRPQDLVDLQVIASHSSLDLPLVRSTCKDVFANRHKQTWPPTITKHEGWDELYAQKLVPGALPTVDEAIVWANDLVRTIDAAESE